MLNWMAVENGDTWRLVMRGAGNLQGDLGAFGIWRTPNKVKVGCAFVSSNPNGGNIEDWVLFQNFVSPTLDANGNTTHALIMEAARPGDCAPSLAPYNDTSLTLPRATFLDGMHQLAVAQGQTFVHLLELVTVQGTLG